MKNFKKILSVIFVMIFIVGCVCPAASAKSETELQFNEDGKFRIMHITDTHFTDFPFAESIAFIEKALDDYKPDLVVLGGDNIKGWFDTSMQLGVKAAIDQLVAPFEERDIPFTFVYGNHDWQTYLCPKNMHDQILARLASHLCGIVTQTLVPKKSGRGRLAAFEILINTSAIRGLIEDNRIHLISSYLFTFCTESNLHSPRFQC